MTEGADDVFELLDLTEYEQTALRELLTLGRTTAPNLAEATGIPKARVYGVLDELADRGFLEVVPGRPKEYQPKHPEEILDRAVTNRRQAVEQFEHTVDDRRSAFLEEYVPRYEHASEDISPTDELFHVVDVGEPSERETKRIYDEAEDRVRVLSKSFEYFDAIAPAFERAIDRGVDVSVLLLDPSWLTDENRETQRKIVSRIESSYPSVGVRFSENRLPWRGTIGDPSLEYETGTAILLVQQDEVPNHMRQAAITKNGAFVAGINRFFDLVWEYESIAGDSSVR